MRPLSDIRQELLSQHASVRGLAEGVKELAERPPTASAASELGRLLHALGDAIDAHNAREEQLLDDIVPTIDAWGSIRAARLDEHHRQEHRRLLEAIRAAAESKDFTVATHAALAAIEELEGHMRAEEEEVLSPNVLRDDVTNIDQTDG
ncbi:MAG: hemerythrin domain-containing protein [Gemmatimonadota bacterium]